MCGLGLFELFINGQKVSDRVLEPAFTQYDKRALYTVFDVAEYLLEGENEFLVVLGDGWYNQTTRDTWGFYRAAWRDCPKMIFQLETDGEFVYSDGNCSSGTVPVVSNALRAAKRTMRAYPYRPTAPRVSWRRQAASCRRRHCRPSGNASGFFPFPSRKARGIRSTISAKISRATARVLFRESAARGGTRLFRPPDGRAVRQREQRHVHFQSRSEIPDGHRHRRR